MKRGYRIWIMANALFALSCCMLVMASGASAGVLTLETSRKVSDYFERAKRSEPELIAFLHKMPKGADLHNHPAGAVFTEYLIDEAIRRDLLFDRTEGAFVTATTNPCYTSRDIMYDFWKLSEVAQAISLRDVDKGDESGHERFFRAFERYGAAIPDWEAVLDELVGRAVDQRISYMELMCWPLYVPQNPDYDILRVQLEELNRFVRRLAYKHSKGKRFWDVEIGYALTLNRGGVPRGLKEHFDETAYEAYFREEVRLAMDAVVNLHDLGARSITILSPEDAWFSRRYFDLQMRVLDEEYGHLLPESRKLVKLNLHGGELTLEYSPLEAMRNRIRRTIELGHASRIGHGLSIMWEDDLYDLLRKMRDEQIAVEICLSSNEGILKTSGGERHPFGLYWDAGVPVSLCTDDEGISRGNLTTEFAKAARWFDLGYGELKWLAFNSLEYSFLPGESMFADGDYNRPKRGRDFPADSEKARKQRALWDAFREFELEIEKNVEIFLRGAKK